MYDFKNYINDKTALIQKMDVVEKKIQELDGMGIDISETIKKIESAKRIVQDDKISVVLVGAFVIKITKNYVDRKIKGKDIKPIVSVDAKIEQEIIDSTIED